MRSGQRILRAAGARRATALALPAGLALLMAPGRCVGDPAAIFTLRPAMFSLAFAPPAGARAAEEPALFGDLRLAGFSSRPGDPFHAAGLSDPERPVRLTLFRDVTFADPAARAGDSEAQSKEAGVRYLSDRPAPPVVVATPPATRRIGPLRPLATSVVMGLAVGVSLQNAMKEPSGAGFRFESEGFFGANTYAGGADKTAHFIDYTIAARLFETTYRRIGYTQNQTYWLAAGTAIAAGLATEIGDGTTMFGFSAEDLLMDALGAVTAVGLSRSGWDDSFGFRFGSVSQSSTCCAATDTYGRDYSGEIYTADAKIAGLAQRLRFDPGIARFLLVSGTYGTNGYRTAPPEERQRLVGIEVGIHFSEILRSLRVPSEPLWGEVLYLFFDSFRIPYTAIGVRYDLNHHQWFAPTAGKTPFPQTGSR